MSLRRTFPALVLTALCACTGADPPVVAPRSPEASVPSDSRPPPEAPRLRRYRPILTQIPRLPGPFARRIVALRREVLSDIDRWTAEGADPMSRLGRRVELESIAVQRLFRHLVGDHSLARRVLQQLPGWLRPRVAEHIEIGARLRALVHPVRRPVRLETTRPLPPSVLLHLFKTAGRRYDVEWRVLAAINFVETRFGRIVGPSSAGALGPMQFLPSTWQQYGRGDIRDPRDAIPAAARLLQSAGASSNTRAALLAYNNSDAYADAVLSYAGNMRADIRNYYMYWSWEVFVVTTKGDVQLTGPGANPG